VIGSWGDFEYIGLEVTDEPLFTRLICPMWGRVEKTVLPANWFFPPEEFYSCHPIGRPGGRSYPSMSSESSPTTSAAAASNTGRLSQTKYYHSNSTSKTTIIRRHHPLIDQQLALLSVARKTVTVRLPDGSSMKILRRWTDVDGIACTDLNGDSEISVQGLKELLSLFMALRKRSGDDSEMITTEQSTEEVVDDETTTVGVSRTGMSGNDMGAVPRARQRRAHPTGGAVDGSHIGGADSGHARERQPGGA